MTGVQTCALPISERLAALRGAFAGTVGDALFVAAERKLGIRVDSLGGEEVARIVRHTIDAPPDLIQSLKAAIDPGN